MDEAHLKSLAKFTGDRIDCIRRILADGGPLTSERFEEFLGEIANRRMALADGLLGAARALAAHGGRDCLLSAVSRAYYAMYNAARAVVFLLAGKDVDNHEALARSLPHRVPRQAEWQKKLNDYRRLRNEADYDPFSVWDADDQWRRIAADAEAFLTIARRLCQQGG